MKIEEGASTGNTIEVLGRQIMRVEYQRHRVVTLRQIDELHGKADGQAGVQFRRNRKRFESARDFFEVPFSDWSKFETINLIASTNKGGRRSSLFLFTEKGYGKIVRGWKDDLSWQLHDAMQEAYFLVKAMGDIPPDHVAETQIEIFGKVDKATHDIVGVKGAILGYFHNTALPKITEFFKKWDRGFDEIKAELTTNRIREEKLSNLLAGFERSNNELIKKFGRRANSREFVRSEWYCVDDIYAEFFPGVKIPRRGFLSNRVTKSLDHACRKYGRQLDMHLISVGGKHYNLWHEDTVRPWMARKGKEEIQKHIDTMGDQRKGA